MNSWSIDFSPILPVPVLGVAAVVALALVAVMVLRGTRGAAFRGLALAAMLMALANPTLRQEERESLGNIAIVVIDESVSQSIADRPAQTKAIREQLEGRLGSLENIEVRWVTGGRPDGGARSGTNLFAALNGALADVAPDRLAGVIFVTDGQVHDVPDRADLLGFAAPVHVLVTGRPGEFDRRIEIITAPRYGIVGQSRDIEIAVREVGRRPTGLGDGVRLRVRRADEPDEIVSGRLDQTLQISMPFPRPGKNILEVELDTAPGELTAANNRVVVVAEGVRENLRVLLVSGEPHAGERTWRNLLKSDAAVDLVHFTILRPPQKQDGTPINQLSLIAFPTRELFQEKIDEFDLIIFDRYQHRGILQLLYYDRIARYVEQDGGALLIAAGDDYAGPQSIVRTPLFNALPAMPTGQVLEEPFRPRLTDDGRRHPVTRDLIGAGAPVPPGASPQEQLAGEPSWGRWFRQVDVLPERGQVVMSGVNDRPLLILDRKGKGRVALLTSDHAWLWARGFDGGGPHTDLLRRLSHWLMKEPDLEEERLSADATGLRLMIERRSIEETVGPVIVQGPTGDSRSIILDNAGGEPGLWRASLEVDAPGLYKLETEATTGLLTAVAVAGVSDPREMSEVTATKDRLAAIVSERAGGQFWTLSEGAAEGTTPAVPRVAVLTAARNYAGSNWMALEDRQAFVTNGVTLLPMFNGFIALAGLLLLITLAWWREGR
ncbi:MAG: hypothetical protein ACFCUN_09600 [Hyphomicrobiaceae bacterium]